VVDRLGDLLELAWLAETAARHASDDATAAFLTFIRVQYVQAGEQFLDPMPYAAADRRAWLIDELTLEAEIANP
jgi:hypothetical protein